MGMQVGGGVWGGKGGTIGGNASLGRQAEQVAWPHPGPHSSEDSNRAFTSPRRLDPSPGCLLAPPLKELCASLSATGQGMHMYSAA